MNRKVVPSSGLTLRSVQHVANPTNILVGFFFANTAAADQRLRDALPDWEILVTDQHILTVQWDHVEREIRKMVKGVDLPPIYGMGFSEGCQPLRSLMMGSARARFSGAAFFDGTHAEIVRHPDRSLEFDETQPKVQYLRDLVALARAGEFKLSLTCTMIRYVETDLTPPYACTHRVVCSAVGSTVLPGSPLEEGGLYVEASPGTGESAHREQQSVYAPRILRRWRGLNPRKPAPPEAPPAWLDPKVPWADRIVLWCENELAMGVKEIPPGSNDSPRIQQYFSGPDFQRAGKPIRVSRTKWCAAAQCFGELSIQLPGDDTVTPRVSGFELERDAREAGLWDPSAGARGDLWIGKSGSEPWMRHVARVVSFEGPDFVTIGGNEADGWRVTQRSVKDLDHLGFIRRTLANA